MNTNLQSIKFNGLIFLPQCTQGLVSECSAEWEVQRVQTGGIANGTGIHTPLDLLITEYIFCWLLWTPVFRVCMIESSLGAWGCAMWWRHNKGLKSWSFRVPCKISGAEIRPSASCFSELGIDAWKKLCCTLNAWTWTHFVPRSLGMNEGCWMGTRVSYIQWLRTVGSKVAIYACHLSGRKHKHSTTMFKEHSQYICIRMFVSWNNPWTIFLWGRYVISQEGFYKTLSILLI